MQKTLHEAFRKFSNKVSKFVGSPWTFMGAFLAIVVWAISGPIFGFSDTWQLVINTSTTIITFLMVFIIQNTQNRDNEALQLKLDELIRSQKNARDSMMDLEELSDDEIKVIQKQFDDICTKRASGNGSNNKQSNNDQNGSDDQPKSNTKVRAEVASKLKEMANRN